MTDRSYSDGLENPSFSLRAAAHPTAANGTRRRSSPSPEEQARREAWGKEWGQIAHQVAAQRREHGG